MSIAAAGAAVASIFTSSAAVATTAAVATDAALTGVTVTGISAATAATLASVGYVGAAAATAAGLGAIGLETVTVSGLASGGLSGAAAGTLAGAGAVGAGLAAAGGSAGSYPVGSLSEAQANAIGAGGSGIETSSIPYGAGGILGSGVNFSDLNTAAGLGGTGVQAIGALEAQAGANQSASGAKQAASGAAQASNYSALVAQQNAEIEKQNAALAMKAGQAQAAIQGQRTRATVGSIVANQGASGLDVDSGSPISVRSSAQDLGELDALTVRRNATLQAYGYEVQGVNDTAQGKLDTLQAGNDILGGNVTAQSYVNQGNSTLLNTVGTAATNFAKFVETGGLG